MEAVLTVLITVAALGVGWLVCAAVRTAYRWLAEADAPKPHDPPREVRL